MDKHIIVFVQERLYDSKEWKMDSDPANDHQQVIQAK